MESLSLKDIIEAAAIILVLLVTYLKKSKVIMTDDQASSIGNGFKTELKNICTRVGLLETGFNGYTKEANALNTVFNNHVTEIKGSIAGLKDSIDKSVLETRESVRHAHERIDKLFDK